MRHYLDNLRNPSPVVHSGLALLALLVNTTLSVYKPWGKTWVSGGVKPKGVSRINTS